MRGGGGVRRRGHAVRAGAAHSSPTRFCKGVPERHQRYVASSAKAACAAGKGRDEQRGEGKEGRGRAVGGGGLRGGAAAVLDRVGLVEDDTMPLQPMHHRRHFPTFTHTLTLTPTARSTPLGFHFIWHIL